MDRFEEMLGQALDDMVDEEMEIRERERESYNQALEDFANALIDGEQNEEFVYSIEEIVKRLRK